MRTTGKRIPIDVICIAVQAAPPIDFARNLLAALKYTLRKHTLLSQTLAATTLRCLTMSSDMTDGDAPSTRKPPKERHAPKGQEPRPVVCRDDKDALVAWLAIEPVSYTHLTLPTILLV